MNKTITEEELTKSKEIIKKLKNYYKTRIVGQENLLNSLLIALLSNGHILVESNPGLAKTTSVKTLTNALNGTFKRIQCTPDLLPSDIIGTQIFNYANNTFETKIGPIFANFVLLDEINRSNAKTQSATLEAMQERQITIDGKIYKLPDIFILIATQNPIEQEGTYNLAEAQLDRFLIKEKLTYPNLQEEIEILNRLEEKILEKEEQILSLDDIKYLQNLVENVYLDYSIKNYIVSIIDATRNPENYLDKDISKYIEAGSSTRGSIALMKCAKANALLNGRNYVIPEDIKELCYPILRHRITLNIDATIEDIKVEQIITEILGAIQTP